MAKRERSANLTCEGCGQGDHGSVTLELICLRHHLRQLRADGAKHAKWAKDVEAESRRLGLVVQR